MNRPKVVGKINPSILKKRQVRARRVRNNKPLTQAPFQKVLAGVLGV